MPRAGFEKVQGVSVELDRSDCILVPGETLSGSVIIDAPTAVDSLSGNRKHVCVRVFGRAKVLIVVNTGEGKDYYRGRAVFFEKTLWLDSPVLQSNQEIYRFSVDIPTHVVPGEYKMNDTWKANSRYLNNTEMDIASHPLPGVFYYQSHHMGTVGTSFVEYVLEAGVRENRDRPSSPSRKEKKNMTVIPLVVRTRSTERPILYEDYLQSESHEVRIKTLRLLAEHATSPSSLRNGFKSVFRPSKVPNYLFDIKVTCPSTLQLDNPNRLPFKVAVVPKVKSADGKQTSTIFDGSDASHLPDVKITAFELCLRGQNQMRARSILKWDTKYERGHDYTVSPDLPPGMVGYVIPRESSTGTKRQSAYRHPNESGAEGSSSPYDVLDFGQLLELEISRGHSKRQGVVTEFKAKRPVWPSFQTYNIALYYEWKYKITFTCAGENQTIEGKQRVEVIQQSEDQQPNIEVDRQGVKRKWKELMLGAEGGIALAAIAAEVIAESV